jgi:hypothetical protein
MQGYAHFLPMGKGTTVSLFGPPDVKLPAWFKQYRWDIKVRYTTTNLFAGEADQGLTKKDLGPYAINVSTAERTLVKGGRFDAKYKITVPNTEIASIAPEVRS